MTRFTSGSEGFGFLHSIFSSHFLTNAGMLSSQASKSALTFGSESIFLVRAMALKATLGCSSGARKLGFCDSASSFSAKAIRSSIKAFCDSFAPSLCFFNAELKADLYEHLFLMPGYRELILQMFLS